MLAEQIVGEDVGGDRRVLVNDADAHAFAVGACEDPAQIVAAGGRHAVAQAREFGNAAAESGVERSMIGAFFAAVTASRAFTDDGTSIAMSASENSNPMRVRVSR